MTRPQSTALTSLGRLAAIALILGTVAWGVAFIVFMQQSAGYQDIDVMTGAFDWMNFGGALAGFGVLALVGYLVAAAIGDFITALATAPTPTGTYTGGAGAVNRWLARGPVGDGVNPDPHADGADRD